MEKEISPPTKYVQQFDQVPEFWQFLIGLRTDDLISELVQNELDAFSSYTKITFEKDRFLCKGAGSPVDKYGWQRLTFLKGAGDKVPKKENRIGVKNHGLKACFKIGDEILIRSAGKLIKQTLYKDGFDNPPSPSYDMFTFKRFDDKGIRPHFAWMPLDVAHC